MSAFMGPVHHWLFNKIKIVEDREKALLDFFVKKYGDKPEKLGKELREKYGPWFGAEPLDELIGQSPINGFFAETIERVETREAALIKALRDACGAEAGKFIMDAAYNHGQKFGRAAVEEYGTENPNPEDIHKVLKNYFLDGMPGDNVVEIKQNSDVEFIEKHIHCLHMAYWKKAGAEERFMCDYICRWIDGFVDVVGGKIKHACTKSIAKGDTNCVYVFKRG